MRLWLLPNIVFFSLLVCSNCHFVGVPGLMASMWLSWYPNKCNKNLITFLHLHMSVSLNTGTVKMTSAQHVHPRNDLGTEAPWYHGANLRNFAGGWGIKWIMVERLEFVWAIDVNSFGRPIILVQRFFANIRSSFRACECSIVLFDSPQHWDGMQIVCRLW